MQDEHTFNNLQNEEITASVNRANRMPIYNEEGLSNEEEEEEFEEELRTVNPIWEMDNVDKQRQKERGC
jgi:hypothetical protein